MPPICLSDEQMAALPPDSRSAFLEHCARELARLPLVGDGELHRCARRIIKDNRLFVAPLEPSPTTIAAPESTRALNPKPEWTSANALFEPQTVQP